MSKIFVQTGRHDAGHLSIRSGQLVGNYYFGSAARGIVSFLRLFNRKLYFGYMHRDVFLYGQYLGAKENLIRELISVDDLCDQRSRNLAFCLYMARVGRNQSWRYPALINRDPAGRIQQITGNTRAFASLLVHEQPWLHYPVLLAEHPDFDAGELLVDPLLIDSDDRLHEVLAVDPQAETWTAPVEINLHVEPMANELWCRLDYVGNGTHHDHNPVQGQALLEEYRQWRNNYKGPVPLAVYTQWPELLIDRFGVWQTQVVGTSEGMLLDHRPGTAERAVRQYHDRPVDAQDHVLWIIQPRAIDLGDLLFWMDHTHSTYISHDWSFILWRRQQEYKNTFISVSAAAG